MTAKAKCGSSQTFDWQPMHRVLKEQHRKDNRPAFGYAQAVQATVDSMPRAALAKIFKDKKQKKKTKGAAHGRRRA